MNSGEAARRRFAYRDAELLESDEARPLRILSEYIGPARALRNARIRDTIVFFGSARLTEDGPLSAYYEAARELARLVTIWSKSLSVDDERFVVCTGGGGGIMEAANRGATDAGGKSIGLNISLPREQQPNDWITPGLGYEFRYFFMRKLWFAYPARALVVFPGGFGTLNELSEMLMLVQTRKIERRIPIVLYGTSFWKRLVDFELLAQTGMIDRADLDLFRFADDPAHALALLKQNIDPGPIGLPVSTLNTVTRPEV